LDDFPVCASKIEVRLLYPLHVIGKHGINLIDCWLTIDPIIPDAGVGGYQIL
jgi:hypothetical protein